MVNYFDTAEELADYVKEQGFLFSRCCITYNSDMKKYVLFIK